MDFYDNQKIEGLEPVSREVLLRLVAHCCARRTDGLVSRTAAERAATVAVNDTLAKIGQYVGRRPLAKLAREWLNSGKLLEVCCRAGVLEVVADGYRVNNFLKWQRSREQTEKLKEKWCQKKRNQRVRHEGIAEMSPGGVPQGPRGPEQEQEQDKEEREKNNKHQATTPPRFCGPDPLEGVVADLLSVPGPAEQPLATQLADEASATAQAERPVPEHAPQPGPAVSEALGARSGEPADGVRTRDEYNAWWRCRGYGPSGEGTRTKVEALLPVLCTELENSLQRLLREKKEGKIGTVNGGLGAIRIEDGREGKQALGNSPVQQNRPPNSATDEDRLRREEIRKDEENIDTDRNLTEIANIRHSLGEQMTM